MRPASRLPRRLSVRPTFRLPRRTVRLRLTLLYGGLFLISGTALLVITYVLVAHRFPAFVTAQSAGVTTSGPAPTSRPVTSSGPATSGPATSSGPVTSAGGGSASITIGGAACAPRQALI